MVAGNPTYSHICSFITTVNALRQKVNILSLPDYDLYDSIHRRGTSTTPVPILVAQAQDRSALTDVIDHLIFAQTQYAELEEWVQEIESNGANTAFKNLKEIYADAIQHITTSRYQATNPSASSGINRRLGHSGSFSSPAPGRK